MKQMYETMNDLGQSMYDFARQIGEVNLRTMDSLAEAQMNLYSDTVSKGLAESERLKDARGYRDIFSVQMDMGRELTQMGIDHARKTMGLMTDSRDTLSELVQKGVSDVAAEVKSASSAKSA